MAHVAVYGVSEFSATPGTSSYLLGGSPAGSFRFSDRMENGDTCWYWATSGAESEYGLGTFASPSILHRTQIYWSNNNDLPVSWLRAGVRTITMLPALQGSPYPIAMFLPGTMLGGSDDERTRARIKVPTAVTFPAGFAGSSAEARIAADADTTFGINRVSSGVTTALGTILISAGETEGVFSAGLPALIANDMIELLGPSAADANLADLAVVFNGTRS